MMCGKPLDPAWISSDKTVRGFFDRLAGTFPGPEPPDDFVAFRRQCEARELAGRERFGHSSLAKNNCAEAMEEAADFANYMFFDVLRHLRDAGNDDDLALALTGALHAFWAYRCARELAGKRRGAP